MNSNSFLSDKCIASDIFSVGGQRAIILRSHQVKNSWDLESLARFYQRSAKDVHTSMGGCMGDTSHLPPAVPEELELSR